MVCKVPECMGDYDFDKIADFARKRFLEGFDTVSLMEQAESQREKEEIALVCLLDVENSQIRDLKLSCRYHGECKVMDCRERLRSMIMQGLVAEAS